MTREKLLKLCDYLECNDASLEAQCEAAAFIRKALAQPEQEPVELMVYRGELCYKSQEDDQSFGMWCPINQDLPFPEGTKLYTTPPQHTWVGLTDSEKYALSNDVAQRGVPIFEAICEAEAKLKAKNECKEKNT